MSDFETTQMHEVLFPDINEKLIVELRDKKGLYVERGISIFNPSIININEWMENNLKLTKRFNLNKAIQEKNIPIEKRTGIMSFYEYYDKSKTTEKYDFFLCSSRIITQKTKEGGKKWKEGLMDSFPNDTYGKKELKIVNEPDYPKIESGSLIQTELVESRTIWENITEGTIFYLICKNKTNDSEYEITLLNFNNNGLRVTNFIFINAADGRLFHFKNNLYLIFNYSRHNLFWRKNDDQISCGLAKLNYKKECNKQYIAKLSLNINNENGISPNIIVVSSSPLCDNFTDMNEKNWCISQVNSKLIVSKWIENPYVNDAQIQRSHNYFIVEKDRENYGFNCQEVKVQNPIDIFRGEFKLRELFFSQGTSGISINKNKIFNIPEETGKVNLFCGHIKINEKDIENSKFRKLFEYPHNLYYKVRKKLDRKNRYVLFFYTMSTDDENQITLTNYSFPFILEDFEIVNDEHIYQVQFASGLERYDDNNIILGYGISDRRIRYTKINYEKIKMLFDLREKFLNSMNEEKNNLIVIPKNLDKSDFDNIDKLKKLLLFYVKEGEKIPLIKEILNHLEYIKGVDIQDKIKTILRGESNDKKLYDTVTNENSIKNVQLIKKYLKYKSKYLKLKKDKI